MDADRSRLNGRMRLRYRLSAAGYSLLRKIQDASHEEAIQAAVPEPPLFLLGFWRSGTTLLHELFCCDPQFGFASTYACLNPFHFLLSEPLIRKREVPQARRPMDEMRYSWLSPQEDEFALLALGAPSPYEALMVPSLMRNPGCLLDLRQRTLEEQNRWAETLRYFLRLLTVQRRKPIVLKSPTHGFRLPQLPVLFPGARYVIIDRNPYEVFASNLKLWQTLLDLYSLELYTAGEIESFVLAAYQLHEQAIVEGTRNIDPDSLARVCYENLVADPIREMERLYTELGIENFDQVRPRLQEHMALVANHKRNRYVLSLEQKTRVDELWGPIIREKGYC